MPRRTPDTWWSAAIIAILFGAIAVFLAWAIAERSARAQPEQMETERVAADGESTAGD